LQNLRVQSLPHFRAAVVHLHGAITIDEDQRAGLVVVRRRKRDAELHGRHRQTALSMHVPRVERLHLLAPVLERAASLQLVPDRRNTAGITNRRSVMCVVSFAVEILLTDDMRRQMQALCALRQDFLDHQHALGTAEPAERGL
jgi:hypothetical protein